MIAENLDRELVTQLHIHLKTNPCDCKAMEELGMIPKKDLVDGATYLGFCRNAGEAIWDAGKNMFTYTRKKFGSSFNEDINHPEDDDGFDLFVPIKVKEF